MISNDSLCNVMCDVDDTILLWRDIHTKGKNKIRVKYAGEYIYLTPHERHIKLIKHWARMGVKIYVWSGHGPKWAKMAVKILKLESYVYHSMCKPIKYMDDLLDPKDILGSRVYLEHK